ncbi:MAG: ribbon-helix-helix domain-containing protein, partial [Candidatus Caldarchaeum sp.]|nr:ribbon-helix-helix domain-containing protein [Candidatus Caldarchaeum sp.]
RPGRPVYGSSNSDGKMSSWVTVRISRELAEAVDRFIESDEARVRGLRSRSAAIAYLVAEMLKAIEQERRRWMG